MMHDLFSALAHAAIAYPALQILVCLTGSDHLLRRVPGSTHRHITHRTYMQSIFVHFLFCATAQFSRVAVPKSQKYSVHCFDSRISPPNVGDSAHMLVLCRAPPCALKGSKIPMFNKLSFETWWGEQTLKSQCAPMLAQSEQVFERSQFCVCI